MARLRPNSVSTGTTDRQLDFTLQSPQPSHTSSLMTTRFGGIGERAALAPAALFGGAGLVVDEHRDAGDLAQLALHRVEVVAVVHRHARREVRHAVVLLRLVGHDDDLLHALGGHLARDHRHGERAVDRLAAGHRDRVVEEDLVGDVDVGRDRGADREQARMEVGAVAQVREHVLGLGERRMPIHGTPSPPICVKVIVSSGGSRSPCSGSRCRPAPSSLRARGSRCCAGSPSRNRGCARPWRAGARARLPWPRGT